MYIGINHGALFLVPKQQRKINTAHQPTRLTRTARTDGYEKIKLLPEVEQQFIYPNIEKVHKVVKVKPLFIIHLICP